MRFGKVMHLLKGSRSRSIRAGIYVKFCLTPNFRVRHHKRKTTPEIFLGEGKRLQDHLSFTDVQVCSFFMITSDPIYDIGSKLQILFRFKLCFALKASFLIYIINIFLNQNHKVISTDIRYWIFLWIRYCAGHFRHNISFKK